MPSKTRGILSRREYKRVLKNEAPETLTIPMVSDFGGDTSAYKKQVKRFKKLGNWATPDNLTMKRFGMKSNKGGYTKKKGN